MDYLGNTREGNIAPGRGWNGAKGRKDKSRGMSMILPRIPNTEHRTQNTKHRTPNGHCKTHLPILQARSSYVACGEQASVICRNMLSAETWNMEHEMTRGVRPRTACFSSDDGRSHMVLVESVIEPVRHGVHRLWRLGPREPAQGKQTFVSTHCTSQLAALR